MLLPTSPSGTSTLGGQQRDGGWGQEALDVFGGADASGRETGVSYEKPWINMEIC